jgi:hypothetical protein
VRDSSHNLPIGGFTALARENLTKYELFWSSIREHLQEKNNLLINKKMEDYRANPVT